MKDEKPVVTTVELGTANDSYTQIKSGVNEGDIVITSIITVDTSTKDDASSLFTGTSTSTRSSQGGMPGGGMMGPGM
jgi:hypothetical protein